MRIHKNSSLIFILIFSHLLLSCNEREKPESVTLNSNYFNQIIDGKREGKHIFFEDGTLESILNFNNDLLDGECVWYYPNGKIEQKITYINDTANGLSYFFYESGVIDCFRKWKDGKKVGYAVDYYDVYSRVKAVMLYNDEGQLVYRRNYDLDGDVIGEEGSVSDTAVFNFFNKLKSGNITELIR